ncbi:MAG: O-antigen ligase family protein [bacterium]|nr:O-antigen ligase family protein [bacterium]
MQYTNYLKWALLGGLGLVFFIPFIVAGGSVAPNMFFPYITGKNFAFRLLVELLFGLYVLLALREPKYRPRASYMLWAFGAFVLWMGIATIFSVDPAKSFWSNFERMEGYITVLHLFVYFLMVGAIAMAERWWDRLFQVSITAGSLQALYSLGQLFHIGGLTPSSQSGARLDGTYGNATYLAVFMLFNIFLTLFMLVRQSHKRDALTANILYGLALVLQVSVLYYTQTRGALLGCIGGIVIAAIYIVWNLPAGRQEARGGEWRVLRKVSLYGLGAIVILVGLFFTLRQTSFVQHSETLSRLASISLSSNNARFQIWNMTYQGFKEKPLLGWGQENFNFVFNKYYQPAMYNQEQWFDRAHNQFLDWLIAGGLPAFLLYISLFGLAVWVIIRSSALSIPEQAILLGLLAGYAFNNLFVFDDLMSSVYFIVLIAFVHSLSAAKLPGFMFLSRPLGDRAIAVAAPVVLVVVLLGAWTLNAPGIARAQNLLVALMTQVPVQDGRGGISPAPKDPKVQLQQFQVALGEGTWPDSSLGKQEGTEQLLQYASNLATAKSVDPSVKQDAANLAQSATQALLQARPHDARIELFYGAFLDTYGQRPQALEILNAALADSPLKQQIMFEISVVYLNGGDVKSALPILQKAFTEEPSYNDARIFYAAGLYYDGDNKTADALLTEGFGTLLVDDTRLLQVYVNTKQFGRLVAIWKNRVDANPNDAQTHVGLAAAHFAAGDKTGAITELERAAALDPTLAAQVQSLIGQIRDGTLK